MTFVDLVWLREQAIQAYAEIPVGATLTGAHHLVDDDRRAMAWYLASVKLLARRGKLAPGVAQEDVLGLRIADFISVFDE